MHGRTRGDVSENEPGSPPAANDDTASAPATTAKNEPADPAPPEFWTVDGVPLLDAWGRPRRHPLAVARERAAEGRVSGGPA